MLLNLFYVYLFGLGVCVITIGFLSYNNSIIRSKEEQLFKVALVWPLVAFFLIFALIGTVIGYLFKR